MKVTSLKLMTLVAAGLLAACTNIVGGGGSSSLATTSTSTTTTSATTTSTAITASLSGAKAILSDQSSATKSVAALRGLGARASHAAPVLSKLLDDGSVAELLNVPAGVTLPPVQFVAVSPKDSSVFILFRSAVKIGASTSFAFIKLDGSGASTGIEIIEAQNNFASVSTDAWAERQKPLLFTDDGTLFYLTASSGGEQLKSYANGMTSVIGGAISTTINRFFTDGSRVYYLGSSSAASASLKMYNPATGTTKTLFASNNQTWIKDCYLSGSSIILSGYNIPDPTLTTRSYSGILKLTYNATADSFDWSQMYGTATDSGTLGWQANRRQLKAGYFQNSDGTVNASLQSGVMAPFFVGGTVPAGVKPFAIVDIDKVSLDSTRIPAGVTPKLEHKFWFGLLSGYSGFDSDFFYSVFLNLGNPDSTYYDPANLASKNSAIPTILYPYTGTALAKSWLFDLLFGGSAQSTYSYSGTVAELQSALKTATSGYFATLAVKSGLDPRTTQFDETAKDLTTFKTWLDANFTYTWGASVLGTSSVNWTNILGYTPLANVFFAFENSYGSPVKLLAFKSAILGSDSAAAANRVLSLVQKFYPAAVQNAGIDVGAGVKVASTWTNNDASKAAAIDQVFTLGTARVNGTSATWVNTGLGKFYEYSTNQGIVDDPYFKRDFGTLFDSLNNLDRFTMASDGSLYAVFRKLGATGGSKVVKLMDGSTGDISGSVVYDGIPTTNVRIIDHYVYYAAVDVASGSSTLARVDFTATAPTPTLIVSPTDGLTVHDFRLANFAGATRLVFTAVNTTASDLTVGTWDPATGVVTYHDWGSGAPTDSAIAPVGTI